jgi:protein subunit release factor A
MEYKMKKMKILMEIRPGEGGDDAKLLVNDQAAMYLSFAERNGLRADVEHRGSL